MSAMLTSSSFRAAKGNEILTLSLETTPAYLEPTGSGVLWPFSIHLAFLVKSIFTDQIRCHDTLVYPAGAVFPSSRISNATPMMYISISSASFQRFFPVFLSSSKACPTLVGISMPLPDSLLECC